MPSLQKVTERERKHLEGERGQILRDMEILKESLPGEVDSDHTEGDPDVYERENNATLLDALANKLQSIEAALCSIENGGYGICAQCSQPIPPARLEAMPDATLCLPCQVEKEKQTKGGLYRPPQP